uniref:C-type lectin domain-containing protein n=1 Tax=Caenorhabditis tropicalis TaxID=1561998 RepID=A0A1I7T1F1_9PELO
MWIGASCEVNKQPKKCIWDDGSAIDYNNFLPGYPVTNIGSCVYLDSMNQPLKGKWISATCGLDEYHAVCEAN